MAYLVVEFEPKQGKDALSIHVDFRSIERIKEVIGELQNRGSGSKLVDVMEIGFEGEELENVFMALKTICDPSDGGSMWLAIDEIVKQAFLAGVKHSRNLELPVLTSV